MNWILVAMGGGIGACLRYGAGLWLFKPSMSFPWPTWWINIIGCFAAGESTPSCEYRQMRHVAGQPANLRRQEMAYRRQAVRRGIDRQISQCKQGRGGQMVRGRKIAKNLELGRSFFLLLDSG